MRSARGQATFDERGSGTLTMTDLEHVTWFSDRPERDAGVSTLPDALRTYGWQQDGDALGTDAPNATLTAPELEDALVVELRAASIDGDRVTFEVQAIESSASRDVELSDLALFIDTTTASGEGDDAAPDPTSTQHPDPSEVATAAGFDTSATLEDHVSGLLAAVGAGPDDDPSRAVELAVRASVLLDASGDRSSVPVLLAPLLRVGEAPTGVADEIERWLTETGARVDELEFDATVATPGASAPILVVHDVELPMRNVELPN